MYAQVKYTGPTTTSGPNLTQDKVYVAFAVADQLRFVFFDDVGRITQTDDLNNPTFPWQILSVETAGNISVFP